MKGLINIKNNDNKYFLCCHIRHLNRLIIYPERITKVDRKIVNDLDYVDIKFPVSKKDYNKNEQKSNICINAFSYENDLVYPAHASDVYLLLLTDENKSHYVYNKDFNKFMCSKTKNKNTEHICRYCLQLFSS